MSDKVIANKSDLVAIADAVRNKTGSTEEYNVSELSVAAVEAISSSEGGTNTTDATATAEEIFEGKTAYIASGKTTGTFTLANELSEQENLISQIETALQGKVSGGGSETIETVTFANGSGYTIAIMALYDGNALPTIIRAGLTYTNVVKGSLISLPPTSGSFPIGFRPATAIENVGTYTENDSSSVYNVYRINADVEAYVDD